MRSKSKQQQQQQLQAITSGSNQQKMVEKQWTQSKLHLRVLTHKESNNFSTTQAKKHIYKVSVRLRVYL